MGNCFGFEEAEVETMKQAPAHFFPVPFCRFLSFVLCISDCKAQSSSHGSAGHARRSPASSSSMTSRGTSSSTSTGGGVHEGTAYLEPKAPNLLPPLPVLCTTTITVVCLIQLASLLLGWLDTNNVKIFLC
ncbi:hypothetical protein ZWY2020_035689 [Hordeum vulgare]|nr:hypothetical protein ZWY2020_035689 [Hordeum vulgare]